MGVYIYNLSFFVVIQEIRLRFNCRTYFFSAMGCFSYLSFVQIYEFLHSVFASKHIYIKYEFWCYSLLTLDIYLLAIDIYTYMTLFFFNFSKSYYLSFLYFFFFFVLTTAKSKFDQTKYEFYYICIFFMFRRQQNHSLTKPNITFLCFYVCNV